MIWDNLYNSSSMNYLINVPVTVVNFRYVPFRKMESGLRWPNISPPDNERLKSDNRYKKIRDYFIYTQNCIKNVVRTYMSCSSTCHIFQQNTMEF